MLPTAHAQQACTFFLSRSGGRCIDGRGCFARPAAPPGSLFSVCRSGGELAASFGWSPFLVRAAVALGSVSQPRLQR